MLRAAVRRLPPAQARAVVMAGIYGMSAHEVAAVDDIASGTVRSRVVDREGQTPGRSLHPVGVQ